EVPVVIERKIAARIGDHHRDGEHDQDDGDRFQRFSSARRRSIAAISLEVYCTRALSPCARAQSTSSLSNLRSSTSGPTRCDFLMSMCSRDSAAAFGVRTAQMA